MRELKSEVLPPCTLIFNVQTVLMEMQLMRERKCPCPELGALCGAERRATLRRAGKFTQLESRDVRVP